MVREDKRAHGIRHTATCRKRIEEAIQAAGDTRVEAAVQRRVTEIARHGEEAGPRAEEENMSRDTGASSSGSNTVVSSGPAAQPQAVPVPVAGPEEISVEGDGEEDMVDNMFKRLPRKVGREATKLYEVLLVHGCDPGGGEAQSRRALLAPQSDQADRKVADNEPGARVDIRSAKG